MHMICWEKITKPKNRGGLGVHSAKGRNLTLAAKLCWRIETSENAGWAKVLKKKYRLRTQTEKGVNRVFSQPLKKVNLSLIRDPNGLLGIIVCLVFGTTNGLMKGRSVL